MIVLLKETPLFYVAGGKQRSHTLEVGSRLLLTDKHSKRGAYGAHVVQGKYEGMNGNIPASFCATDVMQVI